MFQSQHRSGDRMALQMMLPLIRIKAELLTDHRPRDGTQYGRLA